MRKQEVLNMLYPVRELNKHVAFIIQSNEQLRQCGWSSALLRPWIKATLQCLHYISHPNDNVKKKKTLQVISAKKLLFLHQSNSQYYSYLSCEALVIAFLIRCSEEVKCSEILFCSLVLLIKYLGDVIRWSSQLSFVNNYMMAINLPSHDPRRIKCGITLYFSTVITQRQRENICSEDDLRSRIFGTFVVKFLACLPLLGFSNIYKIV